MQRPSTSAQVSGHPPLYWKVPGPEREGQDRDFIGENRKHVKQVSTEVKKVKSKERLQPLKAKFIPGLTKNPSYDHVESRISGLIRGTMKVGPRETLRDSGSSSAVCSKGADGSKPIWGASTAANARRIKSTSDMQKLTPVLRRRPAALKPQHESVYNWHFSDTNNFSPNFTEQEMLSNPDRFAQFKDAKNVHLHRVEYLPCDGICADEPVYNDNGSGDCGSGRSSRGINTEETRIFSNGIGNLRASQSLTHLNENEYGDCGRNSRPARFIATVQQQTDNLRHHPPLRQDDVPPHHGPNYDVRNGQVHGNVREQSGTGDPFVERIKQNMSGMTLNGHVYSQSQADFVDRNAPSSSSSALTPTRQGQSRYQDTSPHKTGAIPKYLKKRQQQWKQDEVARQEAEKAASIPPGHVAMSEAERLENLAKLQSTYDNLVNELNRVPIRIDTIRVREYKQHLEQELTKLEQAMRLFSRPMLYIKVDQHQSM